MGTFADLLHNLPEKSRFIPISFPFLFKTVKERSGNLQEAVGVPVHQIVSFADAFISDKSLERKLVAEVS